MELPVAFRPLPTGCSLLQLLHLTPVLRNARGRRMHTHSPSPPGRPQGFTLRAAFMPSRGSISGLDLPGLSPDERGRGSTNKGANRKKLAHQSSFLITIECAKGAARAK